MVWAVGFLNHNAKDFRQDGAAQIEDHRVIARNGRDREKQAQISSSFVLLQMY